MLKNVDPFIWQNAGVISWQEAGATTWKNEANNITPIFLVQYDLVRLDLVW